MAKARFYYNSRFGMTDVPETIALLEQGSKQNDQDVVALNTEYSLRVTLKVNLFQATASEVQFFQFPLNESTNPVLDHYIYDVTGFKMYSQQVAEITGILNPLLSFGLLNNDAATYNSQVVITGKAARLTPALNESSPNLLPEPWSPTTRMQSTLVSSSKGFPELEATYDHKILHYVASTLAPSSVANAHNNITRYTYDSDGHIATTTTDIPDVEGAKTTEFACEFPYGDSTIGTGFSYQGIGTYCTEALADAFPSIALWSKIEKAYNLLGLQNAIIAKWEVPSAYIKGEGSQTLGTDWAPDTITGASEELDIDIPNSTGINNPKALYYFAQLKVQSRTSGESKIFNWTDIMSNSDYKKASLRTLVDPSFNGRPYIYSLYYKGNGASAYGIFPETIVRGSEWVKPAYASQGAQGTDITNFLSSQQVTDARRSAVKGVLSGAVDIAGGILTQDAEAIGAGAGSAINSALEGKENITKIQNLNDVKNSVYSPAVYQSANIDNLSAFIKNNFLVSVINTSELVGFDRFLTMYGYASNIVFSDISSLSFYIKKHGANFCYVQMDSCNVQLTDTGKNINGMDQLIADRLKAGIRVWKTLPTTTTYNQQNLIDYTA